MRLDEFSWDLDLNQERFPPGSRWVYLGYKEMWFVLPRLGLRLLELDHCSLSLDLRSHEIWRNSDPAPSSCAPGLQ